MQVASVKPNTVCHGRGKEWQQHTTKKTICYTVPDISGYHADFQEGHGTVGAGKGRSIACVD